ncbi:ArgE/DapE family deacylase [Bacillus xiapuensis]|uniref:Probable succinyl-diaminopimelate desuccinylase n=1 Tax=Bacillus xiapuensis TaxID=2014075 RepID=A0ABU6NC23_9BACI|nr:ArgE/DapE family deacylase [Bacillus xiapuensis]
MRGIMIRQLVKERQQELIELATKLIRIPSENPSNEFTKYSREVGQHISEYLNVKGFSISEYNDKESGLVTLVGDAQLTGAPGKRLLFCGHTDVVPAGDRTHWSFDPFSGEVKDGMLLGRGASDMKGGLAALIFVAGLLQELAPKLNLRGNLGVVAVPDEETGGNAAAKFIDQGMIQGDACLIGEPSYPRNPDVGEKASLWFRVTIPGQPGHGSQQPVTGISAIRRGALVVEALAKLWNLRATPPAELVPLLNKSEFFFTNRTGEPSLSQLLYRPSYNPGLIIGGTKVNVVAEKCVIEVDTRVPFGMKPEFVLNTARRLIEQVAPGSIVEPMGSLLDPNWTLETRPIVQALERGIRRVLGNEEPIFSKLLLASSDARHFRRNGIDTVLYGPGLQQTIHGFDERVSVQNIIESAEIYAATAVKYLK